MSLIKTSHAHPNSTILNKEELDVTEEALILYGTKSESEHDKSVIAEALRKLNGIRKAACCNAIRIEPV